MKKGTKTPKRGRKAQKPSEKPGGIQHFLQTWATEAGMDPETLKKYLLKVDYHPEPGQLIPFTAIRKALFGELHTEKIRGEKLRNDRMEREEAEAMGKLIEWDRVENHYNQRFFLPLQSAMDVAPDEVSREWVEKVLKPILRGKIDAPKIEPATPADKHHVETFCTEAQG